MGSQWERGGGYLSSLLLAEQVLWSTGREETGNIAVTEMLSRRQASLDCCQKHIYSINRNTGAPTSKRMRTKSRNQRDL